MSKSTPLNTDGVAMCALPTDGERSKASLAKAAIALVLAGLVSQSVAQDQSSSGMEVFETFTAVGQGESRASNSLNLEALEIAMPGASPEKMIDKVAGVNVVTADPFGFYEFANDVRVRAFSIANLGVTLDGVPVGTSDPRYGTPIGRLVDSANLTTIKVSQGAGDVTTPAYQALGGSIQYFTKDPSKEKGAYVSAAYGSFDHVSLFAKYELGEFLPGFTGYVSGSHFEFTPKGLDGLGKGQGRRFEAKFKYELPSDKLDITYALTYNDRDDYDTASLSYGEWEGVLAGNYNGTGQGFIEYTPWDYPGLGNFNYGDLTDEGRNLGPVAYLDPNAPAGESTNAIFFDKWKNGRMDTLQRFKFDFDFEDGKSMELVTYYQDKNNYGLWGRERYYAEHQIREAYKNAPTRTDIWGQLWYNTAGQPVNEFGEVVPLYASSGSSSRDPAVSHAIVAPGTPAFSGTPTPGQAAASFVPGVPGRTARDENFGGHRYGVTASYTWETEKNKLIFGGWYEFDHHGTERPNFNLDGGSVLGEYRYDQFNFTNYTRYIDQDVMQYWVQNTYTAMDGKLDIIAGVKGIKLDRDANGFLSIGEWLTNQETFRSTTYEDYFLPQFGLLYELSDSSELFFNYSENMATPNSGTITTAGDTFDPNLLAPEYSENFDMGIRGNFKGGSYTVQAYMISYTDRILASAVPIDSANAGAAGNSRYQNVGGVDSWGVEASGDFKTGIEGLTLSGSIALQETTFQEDLFNGFSATAAAAEGYRTEPNPATTGPADAYLSFIDFGGNDLGNTPFVTANFDAIYKKGQFRYNLGGKFYDDVYVNTLNTQPLEGHTVFDAGVSYTGKSDTPLEGWQVSLSIYNLLDEYFWVAAGYTSESGTVRADRGRQYTLKMETKF